MIAAVQPHRGLRRPRCGYTINVSWPDHSASTGILGGPVLVRLAVQDVGRPNFSSVAEGPGRTGRA
jgi:hypothetical protein